MALPSKLKNFNLFNDGNSYLGQVTELTLPKLTRKTEEYMAAGMTGKVEIDYHNEKIELAWTAAGILVDALKQFGALSHNAVQLRFSGGAVNDETGEVQTVEVVVRGRHKEIEMGTIKVGDKNETKYKTICSYYKLTIDDEEIFEFDFINGVEKIAGEDRNEAMRNALGV